ncbi:C45 family autoproteolytic acyltransferase/hydolase [Miniphocaeibacter halophilus]|uniref:Linear amide C-N hydrolase n=1 Tax=Miniphocaeibacter halophilus TaxID=2931922 RepID=A0AC61N2I1_9FIRM|nr:C45 family autoproteolytic acyltransferase/hydolase [Miniphocaeibacter halophilus]QQK08816.1 linear amide C-N hydrolase [Miniphocaeibacter halophilus]
MYHSRWKGNHYEAGFKYGQKLYKNKVDLKLGKRVTYEKIDYGKRVLQYYERFYPEIVEEIDGFSKGLEEEFIKVFSFLTTMYIFTYENFCSIIGIKNEDEIILARNSDFNIALEKLTDSAFYNLNEGYSFVGNTTAMIQIEDGINEHGLACGLTFVYPTVKDYGFNAGFIIRYLLEKCKTVEEAVDFLEEVPIGSSQNIIIADKYGKLALIESNPKKKYIVYNKGEDMALYRTNHFASEAMEKYKHKAVDDIYSHRRYETLNNQDYSRYRVDDLVDLLKGNRGFLCQYNRKLGMDTIWSSIYDVKRKEIYRCEGNPSRKKFKKDRRIEFK